MIKRYCNAMQERHGTDWKRIVAAEMAAQSQKFVDAILKLSKR